MRHDYLTAQSGNYYTHKFEEHGPTPAGVDWNSAASQELRFQQLLRIAEGSDGFSILDYGCGYGALLAWLTRAGRQAAYLGFDVSEPMVDYARGVMTPLNAAARFTANESDLTVCDFAVASGVFNVRQDAESRAWQGYVLDLIAELESLSRRGFAFNMLTSYSDPECMRPDLYYGDPLFYFDHCKRRYSKDVALLHDYGLYEFTLLVRKEDS